MVRVFFFLGGLPLTASELDRLLSFFLFSPAIVDFLELGAVVLDGGAPMMLVSTMVPPSFLNRTLNKILKEL